MERFRGALAGRVRVLAYGLFAAQEKAAAAREVAERFKALQEVLVQRDPAGVTPLLETRVIEATEVTMQRKASEAEVGAIGVAGIESASGGFTSRAASGEVRVAGFASG